MEKNIKVEYENGQISCYITKATEDLKIPSLGFSTEEDAELAVSVAKALKAHDKNIIDLHKDIVYVFRVLGIKNEWTE